jgi:hypothetical protein
MKATLKRGFKVLNKRSDFFAIILLLVLTIIFFHKIIFFKKVMLPLGNLYASIPWSYYNPVDSARVLSASSRFWERLLDVPDVLTETYPWLHYASQQIRMRKIFLWNPLICSGLPFMGYPHIGMFYPFTILFYFLSTPLAFGYCAMLHLFLMGLFTYLFMKVIGLSKSGSFLGAIVAMFNGASISHIFPDEVTTFVWLPAVLFLYEKSLREKNHFYILLGGLALGMGFLTGKMKLVICIALTLLLYCLFRIFSMLREKERKIMPRAIYNFCIICFIGSMIGAIQIIPLFELLPLSSRGGAFVEPISLHLPWRHLYLLCFPEIDQHVGRLAYVGFPALVLAMIALIKRNKNSLFFGAITVIFLLFRQGCILDKFFSYLIPGFKMLAFYDDGVFVAIGFPVAILAGLGLDAIFKKRKDDK